MFGLLQYEFIVLAIIVTVSIGIAGAILSPFLVLNDQALIADGLAHVSFAGLAFGLLFINEPLFISIPFVVIFAVLIKYLSLKKNINNDASIGLISAISLAVGLIIVHKSNGFNQSIEGMLVGNLWTVTKPEVIITVIVLGLITIFVTFFYKKLVLLTYDYKFAKFKGIKVDLLSYVLAALTAVLITISVKTIGTLLISSFVVFPAIIGIQFKKSFKITLLIGIGISILSVLIGIFSAHYLDIPAGSSIVLVYGIILLLTIVFNKLLKGGGYRA